MLLALCYSHCHTLEQIAESVRQSVNSGPVQITQMRGRRTSRDFFFWTLTDNDILIVLVRYKIAVAWLDLSTKLFCKWWIFEITVLNYYKIEWLKELEDSLSTGTRSLSFRYPEEQNLRKPLPSTLHANWSIPKRFLFLPFVELVKISRS